MASKIYDGQAYDIDIKDIYISSSRRNLSIYPNANNYVLNLDNEIQKYICKETIKENSNNNINKTWIKEYNKNNEM